MTTAEQGVAAVSNALYDKVTHYHAAIGFNVPQSELKNLENKLLDEARKECLAAHYEEAINLFTHALAVTEKCKGGALDDPGARGTLIHNIAFCLHCIGEFEAAKAYYEQSLELFKKVTFPLHTKLVTGLLYPERLVAEVMYGGLNHNRIQMTKERLLDISFGRKPDLKQLDGWGRKKPMPEPTNESAAGARQERDEADEEAVGERRPGWLSVSQDAALPEDETDRAEAATAAAAKALASRHSSVKVLSEPTTASSSSVAVKVDDEDDRDDAQQEDARKEWLEYYLKVGEWEKAEALVVSAEEREDLNYLRGRAEREERATRR